MTPAWLGPVLGHPVETLGIERIAADRGLAGALYRVTPHYAGIRRPEAPSTLIAKFPTTFEPMRRGALSVGIYEHEVRCYAELAPRLPVRTPHSYFGALQPDGEGFVLLIEDLGNEGFGDDLEGLTLPQLEATVDALALLHAQPVLDTAAPPDWLPSLARRADFWQLIYAEAWADSATLVAGELPSAAVAAAEELTRSLGTVRRRLAGEDRAFEGWRALLHGDVRPDNLCFVAPGGAPGSPAFVDWQGVTIGTGAYDVAYLLLAALTPEARRNHEDALLRRYHAALEANGLTISFDHCFEDYQLSMLEPFTRMFFLLARGHAPPTGGGSGTEGSSRTETVLRNIVLRAGAAIADLDSGALLET